MTEFNPAFKNGKSMKRRDLWRVLRKLKETIS